MHVTDVYWKMLGLKVGLQFEQHKVDITHLELDVSVAAGFAIGV